MKELENTDRRDFITHAKESLGWKSLEVNFKKLHKDAVIPTYAHNGDVGMDLTAIDVEYDNENDCYIYHTGLAFETDKHYGILLFPRSSNRKTEAYLCNHVGIADSAIYRGEIMLCYKNRTSLVTRANNMRIERLVNEFTYGHLISCSDTGINFDFRTIGNNASSDYSWILNNPMNYAPYKVGERVGQMVVFPYPNVKLIEREELSETDRGTGGFGSTGK